ncbi:bifunctional diguanylate cyclase/phosphodiesterase [Psychromonas hadalis]|uniref:bifunctional diguanylate cyclase/phosphodiesterase n=1 Tax=Psychromonas hadalis TaxID=211669 RepID=UPI0003B3CD73|nr:EAL domain-containing protein [Psychromonas hadalis]
MIFSDKKRVSTRILPSLIVPSIISTLLLLLGLYGPYLMFHFFVESFAIFVALCLGIIVHYTFSITKNRYLQLLGAGYFVIAGLDIMHLLSFPGMPFLGDKGLNTTLTFWVLTRFFEACLLFVSSCKLIYKFNIKTVIAIFTLIGFLIIYQAWLHPFTLYIASEGLTPLKNYFELLIIIVLVMAFVANSRHQLLLNSVAYWEIQVAILFTIVAELCFTLYVDIDGFFNLLGHVFKFLSFWFVFIAVVKRTLQQPIDLLQKDASTYDAIPIPVIILDKKGNLLQINSKAQKLIKQPKSELIGLDAHQFFHPSCLTKSQCPLCLAIKECRALKNVVLTDKNSGRSTRFYLSVIMRDKMFYGVIQVSRDITDEIKSSEKISHQNTILNAVLNGTPDLIFYKDYLHGNGIYLGCNRAFELFVGKSKAQIVGYTDLELFGKEVGTQFQLHDKKVREEKRNAINDEWVTYANGKKVLLSTSKSPLYLDEDHLLGILGISRDITQYTLLENEIQSQKETLEYQTYYDQLTGLPNRTLLLDRIDQEIKLAQREKSALAVLLIDLDHFKEINDSLGYQVGDLVIKEVASRLQKTLRETDTVARLGGDEFAVLLSGLHNTNYVVDIIENLQETMKQAISIAEHHFYCTLSIGITLSPVDGIDAEVLLKNADAAMYRTKDEGRNGYSFYKQEMTEKAFERIVMESSLRSAIKNNEFVVFYQPQIEVPTQKLTGMEALIRWNHPIMGMVSPAKFITLAEETGFIVELDQWTMRCAMKQMVRWVEQGLNPGVLALNLAMKQLQQKDFIEMLSAMLEETECKPEWLALEVTEGQIMVNPENAILILEKVSAMGIELAIDDFGTGYSSLSYLKRLPINKLKIDQSFVRGLPDDEDDVAITKAVIALATNLHMNVIAEGVETIEQVTFLTDNGCYHIQGYYYGKPMPADKMKDFLQQYL